MEHYLLYVNQYCNTAFTVDDAPEIILKTIDKMKEYDAQDNGMTSESLGDFSVSWNPQYPASIKTVLNSFRRVKFL